MRLGIDFGTTRTVVATCDRGNYPVVNFADHADDAMEWYPSVIAERQGELRFGYDAEILATDPSWTVVRSFKRLLAGPEAHPTAPIRIGSLTLTVADLLERFLSALRVAILTRSNLRGAAAANEPLQVVIAAPANARSGQRFMTLDAFRAAGFEVLGLLNEPSAAGFEYTHRHRNTLTSKRDQVVVYDLGGGTFDASLVRMRGAYHDVIATAGANRLGGDDFDNELVDLVLAKANLGRHDLTSRALRLLTDQCREAKERLNPNSKRIAIDLEPCVGKGHPAARHEINVNVAELYEICMPLIERSVEVMRPVMGRFADETRDIPEAELAELAGIYVVGGASALPPVVRALKNHFGRKVHRSPYPSAAIAIGLAIAADESAGLELTDRFSRVFGVFRESMGGSEVTFDSIFNRDLPLPRGGGQSVVSQRTYRAAHNIGHFRYVECSDVENGTPRGDISACCDVFFPFDAALNGRGAELQTIDVRRLPGDGPTIRETYALDAHGIVEVTLANLDAGYERKYRLGG